MNPIQYISEWTGSLEDAKAAGYKGPGWYFWDETWAYCHGPFTTQSYAEEALQHYCDSL